MKEAGFQATPPDWFQRGLRNCKEEAAIIPKWLACCWPLASHFHPTICQRH